MRRNNNNNKKTKKQNKTKTSHLQRDAGAFFAMTITRNDGAIFVNRVPSGNSSTRSLQKQQNNKKMNHDTKIHLICSNNKIQQITHAQKKQQQKQQHTVHKRPNSDTSACGGISSPPATINSRPARAALAIGPSRQARLLPPRVTRR